MKIISSKILFLLLLVQFAHSQTNDKSKNYIIKDNVVLTMPDGGTVCAFVASNNKKDKQPCILFYNIYATNFDSSTIEWVENRILKKGYAYVEITPRGKRCSNGKVEPFEHDAYDAYYIIDWINKQSWCNGKIGMFGGSYLGFAQWAATKHLHPALKTIIPEVAVGAGIDFPKQNGIYMSYMLRWLHSVTDNNLTNIDVFKDTIKWNNIFNSYYKNGYKFASLDSIEGNHNSIFHRWLTHPNYDDYWQKMTPQAEEFAKINIPILTITGYWDDDQLGAIYYYNQHNLHNKNANHYLLIGPYDHHGSQGTVNDTLLGYVVDNVAKFKMFSLCLRWFDYILKDSSKPAILKDKVNFEIAGKNEWRHVSSLSEMNNGVMKLYLNKKYLQKGKAKVSYFINQTIDFKDRSIINLSGEEVMGFPKLLIDSLQLLPEQIMFTSDPVVNPFAICGNFEANLVTSINKKDLDIVIDLYEQLPNGKYLALSENIQRASFAKDKSKRTLLKPNVIQTIKLSNTFITCIQFDKGSRIVVVLGVNKNPNWEINYGTGKDVSQEDISDAKKPLKIKWYNNSFIKFKTLNN